MGQTIHTTAEADSSRYLRYFLDIMDKKFTLYVPKQSVLYRQSLFGIYAYF